MNYALISKVIGDRDRGKLREGARRLAKMAHKYGIPITWAMAADTARTLAKDLTAWHNESGDEPLLMVDIKPLWDASWQHHVARGQAPRDASTQTQNGARGPGPAGRALPIGIETEYLAEHLVNMREKLPKFITAEWGKLTRAMPWAEPGTAGAVWKHHVLLHALEKAGFQCLWGYHHENAETDNGAPFGCFYPSAEQHNFSAPSADGIVGIPYQSPPIENVRAALLNDTPLQQLNIYLENCAWNRWLGYVEHINALEVAELGEETLERLDAYFAHVADAETMKVVPLPEMVRDYRTNCQRTEPTFLLYRQGTGECATAKKAVFYYDAECQLTFTEGTMEPVEMKNYVSPRGDAAIDGAEYHLPKITQLLPTRQRSELRIALTLESTKAMPYGVAIWGDHGGLRLAKSNAEAVAWIGEHLLFARLALQPGNNAFEIILTI